MRNLDDDYEQSMKLGKGPSVLNALDDKHCVSIMHVKLNHYERRNRMRGSTRLY